MFVVPSSAVNSALPDCAQLKLCSCVVGERGSRAVGAWLGEAALRLGWGRVWTPAASLLVSVCTQGERALVWSYWQFQ